MELRQEASDLREYSNAKLDRITRYLGYVADKAHKLGNIEYQPLFCQYIWEINEIIYQ